MSAEPEVIAKAREHVTKHTYSDTDCSCMFMQDGNDHYRVGHILAAYDALRAERATLTARAEAAERDEGAARDDHHKTLLMYYEERKKREVAEARLAELVAERDAAITAREEAEGLRGLAALRGAEGAVIAAAVEVVHWNEQFAKALSRGMPQPFGEISKESMRAINNMDAAVRALRALPTPTEATP